MEANAGTRDHWKDQLAAESFNEELVAVSALPMKESSDLASQAVNSWTAATQET